MKTQEKKEVYLSEEEFSEALRNYIQGSGVAVADYPEGPTAHHEDGEWRLCFRGERRALND